MDVAAARAARGSAGPRRAGAGRCRAWSRRDAQLLAPVQRRHLDLGAADRLGDRERDLDLDVVALALEHRAVAHARDDVQVAGGPPLRPGSPLPASRTREPSRTPAGMFTRYFLPCARRPSPSQVGHGSSMIAPGAAAARARLGDREQALALGLDAAALAARADLRATVPERLPAAGLGGGRRDLLGHRQHELAVAGVHADGVALAEVALEDGQRERVDQALGDDPLERARAVGRVVAEVAQQLAGAVGERRPRSRARARAPSRASTWRSTICGDLPAVEAVELDDVVQAVDELGLEVRLGARPGRPGCSRS